MKKTYILLGLATLFIIAPETTSAATKTITSFPAPTTVEQRVREYFKDAPAMIEIARCESKFRQFTDSGNVLRGGAGGGMVGVFQFYESIHAPGAKALGFDLTTLEGNLGYAKHVYNTQGTTPWNSAKYCWETPLLSASTVSTMAHTPTRAELEAQIKKLVALITTLKKLQAQKAKLA